MGIICHHLKDDGSCVHQDDPYLSQTGNGRYGHRLKAAAGIGVYELVVGKQGKKEYPHLDKKTDQPERRLTNGNE